jgi:hypothetical protein
MKLLRLLSSALTLAALVASASAADSGFKSLFNGKDLTGWEGLGEFWSVRDGAITGVTTKEHQPAANTFLVWKGGDVKNFELRLRFRLTGQNEKNWGNSGVQYRSRIIDPATFIVGGYQADIDTSGQYIGMLYEERGRGIVMKPGQKIRIDAGAADPEAKDKKGKQKAKAKVEVVSTILTPEEHAAAYQKGEWNEMTIIAKGNHLQHFLNGKLTADVTDADDEKGAKSGVLALQLHKGEAMTIEFKDIRLKTLP